LTKKDKPGQFLVTLLTKRAEIQK